MSGCEDVFYDLSCEGGASSIEDVLGEGGRVCCAVLVHVLMLWSSHSSEGDSCAIDV